MRWKGRRQSTNVDDRRRMSRGGKAMGGGIGVLVLGVVAVLLGVDPSVILKGGGGNLLGGGGGGGGAPVTISAEEEELADFIKVVLADTEEIWTEQFRKMGKTYEPPVLVLFKGQTQWAGGSASSAMGPFYSPSDKKVFIDLSFYDQLRRDLSAPGDFAQAYVLAHEVGHHVQHLLGISDRVHRARSRVSETEYNRLSVRLELQADFYGGLWAHHAQRKFDILDDGDIEEALNAASAIGDDTLQKKSRGHAVPDSFTHGTSAQRVAWFRHGFRTGKVSEGDTFDDAVFRRINPR